MGAEVIAHCLRALVTALGSGPWRCNNCGTTNYPEQAVCRVCASR